MLFRNAVDRGARVRRLMPIHLPAAQTRVVPTRIRRRTVTGEIIERPRFYLRVRWRGKVQQRDLQGNARAWGGFLLVEPKRAEANASAEAMGLWSRRDVSEGQFCTVGTVEDHPFFLSGKELLS